MKIMARWISHWKITSQKSARSRGGVL